MLKEQESENPKTLDLIYNEAKHGLEEQLTTAESYNNRAIALIGFVGVILSILMNIGKELSDFYYIIFISCIGFLLFSFILSINAYGLQNYRRDPNPIGLKDYLTKEDIEVKTQILSNRIESYKVNDSTLEKRAKILQWSYRALLISMILLSIVILRR